WTIHRSVSVVGVLADRGELGEAHRVAAQLIESAQRRRHRMDEGRSRWIMAEVLRRQGELEAAEHQALVAVELLRIQPLDQIAAIATLAAILLAEGRAAEARGAAAAAMAQYTAMRGCGFFRGA